jgi:hypothetical protein
VPSEALKSAEEIAARFPYGSWSAWIAGQECSYAKEVSVGISWPVVAPA